MRLWMCCVSAGPSMRGQGIIPKPYTLNQELHGVPVVHWRGAG